MKRSNLWLVIGVVVLAILPLCIPRPKSENLFAGADAQAESVITQINPHYKPWAFPLFEPPSGEVESFLFALQAALGAGVLFYYIGYMRGRRESGNVKEERSCASSSS
ncbi:MAG: energy-coupling factor ABC transporter substrate-binding protein [Armatimonadota bacterium]